MLWCFRVSLAMPTRRSRHGEIPDAHAVIAAFFFFFFYFFNR